MKNFRFLAILVLSLASIQIVRGQSPTPRLVVMVEVPGFRYDFLRRFGPNLSERGINRLIGQGVNCQRAEINYLTINPLVGLVAIATGAQPSTNGISLPRWINHTTGEKVVLFEDNAVSAVGDDHNDIRVSPRTALATTLSDCIKASGAMSKTFSISINPTSAVANGGMSPDGCYWLLPRSGRFGSSSYYCSKLPDWVNAFNRSEAAATYSYTLWTMLHPKELYSNIITHNIFTKGDDPKFDLLPAKRYDHMRLISTVGANCLTTDFPLNPLRNERLGFDNSIDFLSICYDGFSHLINLYGTTSVEVEDMFYRFDYEVAKLIDYLDKSVGREQYLIVLTSPNGSSDPIVANSSIPSGEVDSYQFEVLMNGFLNAQLNGKISSKGQQNDTKWILDFYGNQIFLNREKIFRSGLNLQEVQALVADFAIQFQGVANAITASNIQNSSGGGAMLLRAQNGYFARRSGDVMVVLLPGWVNRADEGANFVQPYNYNSHVPLLFFGLNLKQSLIKERVDIVDIAPTIAHLIGVGEPNAATGRVLDVKQ